jgi:hypothetical protein
MSADTDFVASRGRERRGPRDGDDRVARITRWLAAHAKLPADVVELVLTCAPAGEDMEVLGRWAKDAVSATHAQEINALMLDCANDRGTTVGAILSWNRKDNSIWLSKGFRAKCDDADREVVRPMDGTMQSIMSGMQRHNEAFASQLSSMASRIMERDDRQDARFERLLTIQERVIEKLVDKLDGAEIQAEVARAAERDALELAANAANLAEAAQNEAAEAGRSDPLGQVIEIATKQLLSGGK